MECPVLLYKRIKREVYDCKCFMKIDKTVADIMIELRKAIFKDNLWNLARYRYGRIPTNYTLPKDKDPINKARLISSYFGHPLTGYYQNASTILTWLFKTVRRSCGMFTLFQLDELKQRLRQCGNILNKTYGNDTRLMVLQTDITKMFTNLKHDQIVEAIIWLFEKAKKAYTRKSRSARIAKNVYILIAKARDEKGKKYVCWSTSKGSDEYYTYTVDDILNIVLIDLNLCYQKCGQAIFKQTHGCPIGGFLSPIYANIKCAKDEFDFMNRAGKLKERIAGIRQVDDLLLMIAYSHKDPISYREAKD